MCPGPTTRSHQLTRARVAPPPRCRCGGALSAGSRSTGPAFASRCRVGAGAVAKWSDAANPAPVGPVDELAAARAELHGLRSAAVWAATYPDAAAARQPPNTLAGARRARWSGPASRARLRPIGCETCCAPTRVGYVTPCLGSSRPWSRATRAPMWRGRERRRRSRWAARRKQAARRAHREMWGRHTA